MMPVIRLEDAQARWQASAFLRIARHQLRLELGRNALPNTWGTLARGLRLASYLVDRRVPRAFLEALDPDTLPR